ncbi:hypothetical protein [Ferirhizobium litorale]|uniref:Surface antigen n=1 Tax=Ferirhizobium litorale TaxID=2927786 RepID=A0AAE3Q8V7_9HYPH|nr:hypothetical protein [Fererhizobium litorale]MDI7921397.1 hypothetical protein [Fererhizobium litorale]
MNFPSRRLIIPACVSAIALTGCSTAGGSRTMSLLSSEPKEVSTPYLDALQGGIVGRTGIAIGAGDKQRALEAEYRALEAAPGGQPVSWSGRGVSGEVVAAAPYQVGSQNCRQYTHTVTANGREARARGAACRNANGTWTPLT